MAALIADGRITRRQRILDVGCGTGTDVLTLARWGFDATGIDPDARALGTARARAKRLGLAPRLERASAEEAPGALGRDRFDVVLHTLVANNLRDGLDEHFAAVAALTRRKGLLVLHERIRRMDADAPPGGIVPHEAVLRHFRVGPGVVTQLAEHAGERGPPHARVALWIGARR